MAETASLSDAVAGRISGLRPAPAEYFGGDAIVKVRWIVSGLSSSSDW